MRTKTNNNYLTKDTYQENGVELWGKGMTNTSNSLGSKSHFSFKGFWKCGICEGHIHIRKNGFNSGNNSYPLIGKSDYHYKDKDGKFHSDPHRCCDWCNENYVIPVRTWLNTLSTKMEDGTIEIGDKTMMENIYVDDDERYNGFIKGYWGERLILCRDNTMMEGFWFKYSKFRNHHSITDQYESEEKSPPYGWEGSVK